MPKAMTPTQRTKQARERLKQAALSYGGAMHCALYQQTVDKSWDAFMRALRTYTRALRDEQKGKANGK